MKEQGTRPSVNRKTVYAHLCQKIAQMETLNIIIEEYELMVEGAKEKLEIIPAPIKPENIKPS